MNPNPVAAPAADTCAGPGFATEPLPADEQPVVAFSLNAFWLATKADDPADSESWQKQPEMTAIARGEWMFDLRREGGCGRVLCISPTSRRTIDLPEGTMLVLCHTTGRLSVQDIRAD